MQTLTERYDTLLHSVCESPCSQEELSTRATELFPEFNPDPSTHIYKDVLSPFKIESYGYYRGLGMDQRSAAYASELTNTVINEALTGKGIDLFVFTELMKIELFSQVKSAAKHLRALDQSMEKNAAVTFLEKVFPQQYGPKSQLSLETGKGKGAKWEVEVHNVTSEKEKDDGLRNEEEE